jgi:hypothetical protein
MWLLGVVLGFDNDRSISERNSAILRDAGYLAGYAHALSYACLCQLT